MSKKKAEAVVAEEEFDFDEVDFDVPEERFRILRPADLAKPVEPIEWLAKAFWPLGSHGPIGGRKKTLKTYMASAGSIAVAAGVPVLGNAEWAVPKSAAVLYFGGEGGEKMHRRRLQRIARDVYDIDDISTIPLYLLPDVAPFDTQAYAAYLDAGVSAAEEDGFTVGLVVIDSVYNYHPAGVEVGNVYERGRILGSLSALVRRVVGEDSVLWLVDHFKKTGDGALDLDSLSQAGMGEFADTWLLLDHRHGKDDPAPDPDAGRFYLRAEFGSRQSWPGAGWEINWDIGTFDVETSSYDKRITVEVQRTSRAANDRGVFSEGQLDAFALAMLEESPWEWTETEAQAELRKRAGVGAKKASECWGRLRAEGLVCSERRKRPEGASERLVTRALWAVNPNPVVKRVSTPEGNPDPNRNRGGKRR